MNPVRFTGTFLVNNAYGWHHHEPENYKAIIALDPTIQETHLLRERTGIHVINTGIGRNETVDPLLEKHFESYRLKMENQAKAVARDQSHSDHWRHIPRQTLDSRIDQFKYSLETIMAYLPKALDEITMGEFFQKTETFKNFHQTADFTRPAPDETK